MGIHFLNQIARKFSVNNCWNSHFGGVAHGPVDLTFAVLEKVFGAERIERQLREAIWIRRLSTARPDGCNVKEIHFPAL